MAPARSIGRRPVPGTQRTASVFGLVVDPPLVAPPAADRQFVALLRKARGEGVTVFDVSGGAHPVRAERLLAAAFPDFDPELLIIAPGTGRGSSRRDRPAGAPSDAPDHRKDLASNLAASRRHLAPQVPGILEWSTEAGGPDEMDAVRTSLEELRDSGEVAGWLERLASDRPTLPERLARDRPRLFSTELSVLEAGLFARIGAVRNSYGFGGFVRDPFAGGRLDGTRFDSSVAGRAPMGGPVDVRALREEFAPVLRLGFLALPHRRTLAQASLQFLLSGGWVTSILLPVPRPERWEEIFGTGAAEPLSEEELQRLGALGTSE